MDKQPAVTVIIPVYRTEQFIEACVDSALAQNYPKLDIILVDDGSDDGSPAVCDRIAAAHAQVSVIHQENQGVGAARNTGLLAAAGEYVFFMDSDDLLDTPDAIRLLAARAVAADADITCGSFRRLGSQGVSAVNFHHLREGAYTRTVDFRFQGFFRYGHLAYNWGKLYRRSFLLEHELLSGTYPFTQDKAHNMACCAMQPVYAFIPESVYRYRENDASVTFRYKKNLTSVWIAIASDFSDLLQARDIREDYGDLMAFHIFFGSFFLAKQELAFHRHGITACRKALKNYGRDPFVHQYMNRLARGRYVREITPASWRFVIRSYSVLFSMHTWLLLTLGIALLRRVGVDTKITQSRYTETETP